MDIYLPTYATAEQAHEMDPYMRYERPLVHDYHKVKDQHRG